MKELELRHGNVVVFKFGTECIRYGSTETIDKNVFYDISRKTAEFYKQGYNPVIVSSGAVFMGMNELGISERPEKDEEKQHVASIGQPILLSLYRKYLNNFRMTAGQTLVTHSNLEDPKTRGHIVKVNCLGYKVMKDKRPLKEINGGLYDGNKKGSIAVFNENDAINNEELKSLAREERNECYFGDNDMLSYLVARDMGAKVNVMFNVHGGLWDGNKELIRIVRPQDHEAVTRMVEGRDKSEHGTGGIETKVEALVKGSQEGRFGMIVNAKYITDSKVSFLDILDAKAEDMTIFYPVSK